MTKSGQRSSTPGLSPVAVEKLKQRAREQAGVLLPGIDPSVGEIFLSTMWGNPGKSLGEITLALVASSPPEMAGEFFNAAIEIAVCKEHGKLVWLEEDARSILLGIRPLNMKGSLTFGPAKWPVAALYVGPPKLVRVVVNDRYVPIWMATGDLEGAVVRMSEVTALAQIMIEAFGGRVIEDRLGPETMRQSYIENNMSKRAKARADAKNHVDRLMVTRTAKTRPDHARVALAESIPGLLEEGDRIKPVHDPERVFEVESRISDDYVLVVAVEAEIRVGPGGWTYEDDDVRFPDGMEELVGRHVGFTDDPALPPGGVFDEDEAEASEEEAEAAEE